jgi:hypothetical protein
MSTNTSPFMLIVSDAFMLILSDAQHTAQAGGPAVLLVGGSVASGCGLGVRAGRVRAAAGSAGWLVRPG